jgi:DNA topoisomerase-1
LIRFGEALGEARARNEKARHGFAPRRTRILAAMFWLLDRHALRIGHENYAAENGSFGATTLRQHHFLHAEKTLVFPAKSGAERHVTLTDRRARGLLRRLSDLPGQHLFQYSDDETGELRPVTSDEVNAYLAGLFGEDVTAKTFRTWHGSTEAFTAAFGEKRRVDDVLEAASQKLGNTKAVARGSYVHPQIISDLKEGRFADGSIKRGGPPRNGLTAEESAFMRWLEAL